MRLRLLETGKRYVEARDFAVARAQGESPEVLPLLE